MPKFLIRTKYTDCGSAKISQIFSYRRVVDTRTDSLRLHPSKWGHFPTDIWGCLAYYLPESEYVYWAHSHPEYIKGQIIGLVNLVSSMKSWKRKTRLEVLEKIDTGT